MNDERDSTTREDDDTATTRAVVEQPDERTPSEPGTIERPARSSDDFLVPGPTPDSNAGLARWGLTWLVFSLLLILLMLGVSFACLMLAQATGLA